LPDEPFEYAEWRIRRVGLDYHVDIQRRAVELEEEISAADP
jgi:hypothetical protein